MKHQHLYIIIMAGGIGSRFWPMSRQQYPKQFHDILGRGRTLIQETFDRFAAFVPRENIYFVINDRYDTLVHQQIPGISPDQVLLEPVGRNTAPCVAYAVYKITQRDPEAVFVVAPADHLIAFEEIFRENIERGVHACSAHDMIMTLGIKPTRPDTGYGYIQYIEDQTENGYFKVKTFTEKPNLEVAQSFLDSGDFVWNAGIFLFSAPVILRAFDRYLPDMAELFGGIAESYYTPGEQAAIAETYAVCKNISIDYGIMEKADNVYVIPSDFGWSDLGTWGSVYENSVHDTHDNATYCKSLIFDAANNIVRTDNPDKVVILKGIKDFIIVDTHDALLICRKDDEQFIKHIVSELKAQWDDRYV
ncbi:MAG: mannose-1-phosphate guanylyltransferase [Bacteroidia bacterium]